MESLNSKITGIEQLIKELNIDGDTKESKVILKITDVLKSMASELQGLKESNSDMEECLNDIDEELVDIESYIYDSDDDIKYDEIEEDDFVKLICPHCSEMIYIDEKIYKDNTGITCPNCQKSIQFK